ncbi:MAG TPA: hypothetical protein VK978_01515 [Candidatus Saccharimonadales bacterium]|nr:hypothetical protein [Candidatus Saccharimonadales bacterium]
MEELYTNYAGLQEQQLAPEELLDHVKQQIHERSEREGRIVELGTLSGGQHEELWTGAISLSSRLEAGELTQKAVDAQTARINSFFVPAVKGAAKRCIDGSSLQGYDDADPRSYGRALGPQIQGGSLGEAVALRMWEGLSEQTTSLADDLKALAERGGRYAVGDHTDDHADGTKTGCGQYDGQMRKLPRYEEETYAGIMKATADAILAQVDIPSQQAHFERLQRSAAELAKHSEYFAPAEEALAALRGLNPDGVETLVRPHNEVSLTINFVPGTTFHRDHYNAQTHSKIQNFGLDAWNIVEEHGEAGYALVVDAVATAMDLTDGTLKLYARLPRD